MPGARQKDPNLLANKRGGRGRGLVVLARDEAFIAPAPPTGLGVVGRRAWEAFWQSDVSSAVDVNADRVDLENWVKAVEQRERFRKIADKAPLVKGRHGQLMVNPLNRRIRELSEEIGRVSDRFGMNPMARWRLQFTVSEAGKSVNDLLKMLSSRPSIVLSRRQLIDAVWSEDWVGDEHLVDVHIAHLRRKLGEISAANIVDTVRGVGYRMGSAQ